MQRRWDILDVWRATAILAVIAFHYFARWAPPFHHDNLYGFTQHYPAQLGYGALGVHLFFVISGMLVPISAERAGSAQAFIVKRIGRLFPAFFVASLLTMVLVASFGPNHFHRDLLDWLASLTFAPQMFGRDYVDGAYWSLWVEVRFYVWTVVLVTLFGRRFWLGLIIFSALSRLFVDHFEMGAEAFIPEFMPLFLIGVAASQFFFKNQRFSALLCAATAIALWQLDTSSASPVMGAARDQVRTITIVAALVMIATFAAPAPPLLRPLVLLGRISYALYLVHQYIGVTLIARLTHAGLPDIWAIATALSAMIALALLIYLFVEKPAQNWLAEAWRKVEARRIRQDPLPSSDWKPS